MLKYILTVLLLCGSALAGTQCQNTNPSTGLGTDIPTSYCVTTPDPDINGGVDRTCMKITYTTTLPSDSLAQLELPGTDVSGLVYGQFAYNPTISTSHVIHTCDIPGLHIVSNGGTYGVGVANCSSGPNCPRYPITNWSSWPFANQTTPQFTIAPPDTGAPFSWIMDLWGSKNPYLGHSINYSINGYQINGPIPNNFELSTIQVDGQNCNPVLSGASCGSIAGIKVQLACSYYELISAGTNNYLTQIDANGKFSCPNTPIGIQVNKLRVSFTTGSLGVHTIHACGNALSGSTNLGTACTDFNLTVQNVPSFSIVPPTDFTSPPSVAAYNAFILNYVVDFEGLKNANKNVDGSYCNDAWSANETTFNPCGISAYGGDGNALRLGNYLQSNYSSTWISNHTYHSGDILIDSNGFWESEQVGTCTSTNGSHPVWHTSPAQSTSDLTVDNTCRWGNINNYNGWIAYAQRLGTQVMNFYQAEADCHTSGNCPVWQEFNLFTDYENMSSFQQSHTPASTLANNAVQYTLYPLVTGNGAHIGQKTPNNIAVPIDTVRTLPYAGMSWLNYDLLQNRWITEPGGFDAVQRWLDVIYDLWDQMEQCSPHTVNANYPCGGTQPYISAPTYDASGLAAMFATRAYQVAVQVGHTPDSLILPAMKKFLDWNYSNEFNQTGSDYSQPYSPWFVPLPTNLAAQTGLNSLTADPMYFVWSKCGDSCTLPISGANIRTAADLFFTNAMQSPNGGGISGKAESQIFWTFLDSFNKRRNTGCGVTILPACNTYAGPYADLMEPYNVGEPYPAIPTATNITASTADIVWYTFKATVSTCVKYLPCPSNPNAGFNTAGGAGSVYAATIGEYQNTVHLTALSGLQCYNFGVCATDSAGNTAYSDINIALNSPACCYTFTTTGSPNLQCCIPPILPIAKVGVSYSVNITAYNGNPPYTYSIISGAVPGLSINSSNGTFSGTPTIPGTYHPVVHVVDSHSNQANKTYTPFVVQPPAPSAVHNLQLKGTIKAKGKLVGK